jgi:hypothetical protein
MQVFLPIKVTEEKDIWRICEILDRARANKQIMECKTILNGGWPNHPCSKMYAENEQTIASLLFYSTNLLLTFNKTYGIVHKTNFDEFLPEEEFEFELPHWFTDENFYSHHAAALIRKNPTYYTLYPDVLKNAQNLLTNADIEYLMEIEDEEIRTELLKHKFNFEHNTGGETELFDKISSIYKKMPNIYWSHKSNTYIYYPQQYS